MFPMSETVGDLPVYEYCIYVYMPMNTLSLPHPEGGEGGKKQPKDHNFRTAEVSRFLWLFQKYQNQLLIITFITTNCFAALQERSPF